MPRRALVCLSLLFVLAVLPAHGEEGAAEAPAPRKPVTIRVASFNTWLIPLFSKDYEARRKRLPDALRACRADVICLQEVWSAQDQEALAKALEASHPHAVQGGGGLCMLSRFPITSSAFTPYPRDEKLSLHEQLAGKGYLTAVLATPAGPVEVVTTHLAAMWGEDSPRHRQQALLVEYLKAERPHPLIVAGDLNEPPVRDGTLNAAYKQLLAADFTDTNPPTKKADGSLTAGRSTRVGWRRPDRQESVGWVIDYILYRAAAKTRVHRLSFGLEMDTPESSLSDHRLLLAELRLQPVVEAAAAAAKE